MSPAPGPGPDGFREHLSAWHDGALEPEPSRFVLRRLAEQAELREQIARWQRIGDALRRQPQAAAIPGFAERVAAAIATPKTALPDPARCDEAAVAVKSRIPGWGLAAALVLGMPLVWFLLPPEQAGPGRGSAVTASSPAIQPPLRLQVPSAAVSAPGWPGETPAPERAQVPALVRAPQPSPEQLAPLPAIEPLPSYDPPARPWPRSALEPGPYTVTHRPDDPQPASR